MARPATGFQRHVGSVAAGATRTAILEVVWDHGTTGPARVSAASASPGQRSRTDLASELRQARSELGSHVGGGDSRAPESPPGLEAAFEESVSFPYVDRDFASIS